MPNRDGTGPWGNRGYRGWRCRRDEFVPAYGRRFEQRVPFAESSLTKEDEKKFLEIELKEIEKEKQETERRLKELE
ncbi:MAG: hypothetical protein KAI55_01610 [Candidatus Aenigmarchaeota archaeon]|nr:hypothetical protein [Candidatus Aenigmarchaeota archaeon]